MSNHKLRCLPTPAILDADAKAERRRTLTAIRVARLREKRGAAVGTSISLPPEIHEAAVSLLCISRRGRGPTSQARAYLQGIMMQACAGQSSVAREMATEFSTIKAYLASLDATDDSSEASLLD